MGFYWSKEKEFCLECESPILSLETPWVLGESVEKLERKLAGGSFGKVNLMFLSKQATASTSL